MHFVWNFSGISLAVVTTELWLMQCTGSRGGELRFEKNTRPIRSEVAFLGARPQAFYAFEIPVSGRVCLPCILGEARGPARTYLGLFRYHISLSANWTCREVVVVEVSKPALPVGAPVESKICVLSGMMGTEKLLRFKILQDSARNCTLKFSEIALTGMFFNSEKSRFERPGPVRMFRPALPRRLKHCGKVPTVGSQCAE